MSDFPRYRLEKIIKNYPGGFSLDIPLLEIKRGDSLGLFGPNGSGKSTLLKILAFLEKPDSGEIYFDNLSCSGKTDISGKGIVFQLQEPYLLKRSVYENVAYGLKRKRSGKADIKKSVNNALELVGLDPQKFSSRKWYQLSGGEAVRVALAARLVLKPSVLIMDEPMSNIDVVSSESIKKAIVEIHREQRTTLIVSSHDLVWLNEFSDNILRMHSGRIAGYGMDNIISGPWEEDIDGLWSKNLGGCLKIYGGKPPSANSTAIIEPSKIMVSTREQHGLSAQNSLKGWIKGLSSSGENSSILAEINVNGFSMNCYLTRHALNELKLVPGMEVWLLFKASSLRWQ
jgi:tungstate transport system ATP-binding protein